MSLSKLLDHYSSYDVAPIRVTDIKDSIISYGVQEKIEFIESNLDTRILKGIFRRFRVRAVPYGDPENWVHIYYARQMSFCWHRFVCCKELMHVYDKTSANTHSKEEVESLIENLSLPQTICDPKIKDAIDSEIRAHLLALHILVPDTVLENLRFRISQGKIRIEDTAYLLKIPAVFVQFLFSDKYKELRTKCLEEIG